MKKIIAALLAVVMIMTVAFAFASCSSKKYTDKEVTIPVTDENGETVTDEQGKVVTEVSTKSGKTAMLLQLFLLQRPTLPQKLLQLRKMKALRQIKRTKPKKKLHRLRKRK